MPRPRHVASLRAAASLVLACVLVACGDQPPSQADAAHKPGAAEPAVDLDFESAPGLDSILASVTNAGTSPLRVVTEATAAGEIDVVAGPGGGKAIRFPSYTTEASAPTAVLVARPEGSSDDLEPGTRDFAFGATFRVDAASSGSATDDGDNLVQRGAYGGPGQFKIQVDHRIPSCRVAGSDGALFVEADHAVAPDTWYVVTCRRRDDRLRLTLEPFGEASSRQTWRAYGATGAVTTGGMPLSIGGKVSTEGLPVASADQFNGSVDDVFVTFD